MSETSSSNGWDNTCIRYFSSRRKSQSFQAILPKVFAGCVLRIPPDDFGELHSHRLRRRWHHMKWTSFRLRSARYTYKVDCRAHTHTYCGVCVCVCVWYISRLDGWQWTMEWGEPMPCSRSRWENSEYLRICSMHITVDLLRILLPLFVSHAVSCTSFASLVRAPWLSLFPLRQRTLAPLHPTNLDFVELTAAVAEDTYANYIFIHILWMGDEIVGLD